MNTAVFPLLLLDNPYPCTYPGPTGLFSQVFPASSSILAGSPNPTGKGEYNVGGDGQGGTTGGGISGSGGGGLTQHSKQFDAWSSWDE